MNSPTPVSQKESRVCCLCGRCPKSGTTEHHLIPRQCHSNKWFKKRFTRAEMQLTITVCRACHSAIHRFIPNHKELARHYNTKEALLSHDELAHFITWVRKQK